MGGDHRTAKKRIVVGRLLVKGSVAGVGGFLVRLRWGPGGAEVGGSAYGGEYRGWFLVFSMGWLGSWALDLGSGRALFQ